MHFCSVVILDSCCKIQVSYFFPDTSPISVCVCLCMCMSINMHANLSGHKHMLMFPCVNHNVCTLTDLACACPDICLHINIYKHSNE